VLLCLISKKELSKGYKILHGLLIQKILGYQPKNKFGAPLALIFVGVVVVVVVEIIRWRLVRVLGL
jgi:hypothetical protein